MINDAALASLDPEDELALRIGRVARAHVQIDNSLRAVYQSLVSPGLGVYLVNRITSTNGLVADCRAMLAKAALDEGVTSAANSTLDAASAANNIRNRVVHDMWLRDVDGGDSAQPRWVTYRRAKGQLNLESPDPPRDLTFLDTALAEMTRTVIRVNGLNWALFEVLPFFEGSHGHDWDSAGQLAAWIAVMEDRFDLLDNGGFRPRVADTEVGPP